MREYTAAASSVYFLFGDHLGSTSVATDILGSFRSRYLYKAWGELRYTTGEYSVRYKFTSQREEAALSLYDYRARFYDPLLGRFIQPDSLVPGADDPLAWDRYAYANNSPLVYSDPTGHFGIVGGVIGGAIGGMVGAIGYFSTNLMTFDSREYWLAVGAGVVSGALIGSGIGIAAAPTTTAALSTLATAMIGSGSAAAFTQVDYMASNRDSFETTSFVETTVISGVVGGTSSLLPMTRLGVAAKGLTYIAGAEVQYALQTDQWTVTDAQQAVIYGTIGALFDVGNNSLINSIFYQNSWLSNHVWPGKSTEGKYPLSNRILQQAVLSRGRNAVSEALGNFISGSGTSLSLGLVRRNLME